MKTKLILASLLILFTFAVFAHSIVLQQGTLQVVLSDIRSVIIDQQRYQLSPDAKIYKQSNPNELLPLTASLEGYRVAFDLRHVGSREPLVLFLMLLD